MGKVNKNNLYFKHKFGSSLNLLTSGKVKTCDEKNMSQHGKSDWMQ
jgi:hypothetical protein